MAVKRKPKTTKARRQYMKDKVKEHRQREKDRKDLIRDFMANAPEGIGEHIRFGFHEVDGQMECYIDLKDQAGADYMNEYSQRLGIDPKAVMREMAQHALMKLKRGEFGVKA